MSVAAPSDSAIAELFSELLRRTHLCTAGDVGPIVAEELVRLGASQVALYLVDYEQRTLVPLRGLDARRVAPLSVHGTIAGRAFSTSSILRSSGDGEAGERLWVPLIDGTERLGVMEVGFASGEVSDRMLAVCQRCAHLTSLMIVTKSAYGDVFEVTRRSEPMTIASELLWQLAPPLVFATDRLVVAGMFEPSYDNGGDAFDYAVDDGVLHVGVFDAMGHGLAAAGVAAFALSAYRHRRRRGCDLLDTYAAMHHAVGDQFPDDRYVTAIIAQLDIESGRLRWVSAGHPPPLIVRHGKLARTLAAPPATPLGLPLEGIEPVVAEESLEPGDLLLLYTDGLTEARRPDGQLFTVAGLAEFIEREAAAGRAAPETLRRLRHAILEQQAGPLRDEATAVLIEWRRGTEADLVPDP